MTANDRNMAIVCCLPQLPHTALVSEVLVDTGLSELDLNRAISAIKYYGVLVRTKTIDGQRVVGITEDNWYRAKTLAQKWWDQSGKAFFAEVQR